MKAQITGVARVGTKAVLAILLSVVIVLLLSVLVRKPSKPGDRQKREYAEVSYLRNNSMGFEELTEYFKKLAKSKGAVYAYEVLKVAPIPPNIDMHLMGHAVGDILFAQEGADGIRVCTNDFRNACSHSIVVGLFLREGEKALPAIIDACKGAPGGKGAYTMCFHGLGHGVLAAYGYNLPKAVESCRKTGSATYGFREFPECVGGAVMEIVGGGFHDPKKWEEQSKRFVKKDDPLSPCDTALIPDEAKDMCYEYLTPHLLTVAGADLGAPKGQDFEKAFTFCRRIDSPMLRNSCFRSFGKEFVVLVAARDIRAIEGMSDEQLKDIYRLCGLAKDNSGITQCMEHALDSLYWGGENDVALPLRFCRLLPVAADQNACYTHLTGAVHFYQRDKQVIASFCRELPQTQKETCETWRGEQQ